MKNRVGVLVWVGLWMALTIASFAGMAVAAREMSANLSVFQMLAMRSIIGLAIVAVWMRASGARLPTRRPLLQLTRNAVHFTGQYCWTLGVIALPLAEVVALEFTVPLWGAVFAVLLLGERLTATRAIAIVGGFVGVLIIVRPGTALLDPMTLVVLFAATCFAGSVLMVKVLTRSDSVAQVLFYQTLMQLPMGLVLAWSGWVTPALVDLPWILLYSIGGLTAHLGLAKALALTDAIVVMPVDYLRLPVISLVGFVLYRETLEVWVLAGAALIMASSYYSIRAEARAAPPTATPEGDR